jgi:hypothetical protein
MLLGIPAIGILSALIWSSGAPLWMRLLAFSFPMLAVLLVAGAASEP